MRPTVPVVSRKAIRFSPRSRTRTGSESGPGSSLDMRAGTQYSRMSSPMVVPGPTLVRVSLSCFESIAVLRCCLLSDRVSLLLRVGGVKRRARGNSGTVGGSGRGSQPVPGARYLSQEFGLFARVEDESYLKLGLADTTRIYESECDLYWAARAFVGVGVGVGGCGCGGRGGCGPSCEEGSAGWGVGARGWWQGGAKAVKFGGGESSTTRVAPTACPSRAPCRPGARRKKARQRWRHTPCANAG